MLFNEVVSLEKKKVYTLVGCALILFPVLAGAQAVAPPLSFFAEDGGLNCHIIVGSKAAAQDVVCATQLAAFLGTLLYEVQETTIESELYISEHEDIPPGMIVYDNPMTLE